LIVATLGAVVLLFLLRLINERSAVPTHHTRISLAKGGKDMFVVAIDGNVASVTNDFDIAASYADGIRVCGRRVTITKIQVKELSPVLRMLEGRGVGITGGKERRL
jgi:hypothetical protein